MTPSEKLQLALRYIGEARDEMDEAASHGDPYTRTARRQSLKGHLQAARELLARLERDSPEARAPHVFDEGIEGTMSVVDTRIWAYHVEASVMVRCYEDFETARHLVERVIAIRPESAQDHAWLGVLLAEQKHFDAAIASMKRAISLAPDSIEFKRNLNDIRREAARVAAEKAAAAKRSIWNPRSWLG